MDTWTVRSTRDYILKNMRTLTLESLLKPN